MNDTVTEKEQSDNAADATLAIMGALQDLFGGAQDYLKLPSREEEVCFYPAKVKHLAQIGTFVQSMVASLSDSELVTILKLVSAQQQQKLENGTSPYLLDTDNLVRAAIGDTPLGVKLMTHGVGVVGHLVPLFTNLKPGEFEELDMDEGLMVAYGVFAQNYAFFTQRLSPVIAASIANLKARKR